MLACSQQVIATNIQALGVYGLEQIYFAIFVHLNISKMTIFGDA